MFGLRFGVVWRNSLSSAVSISIACYDHEVTAIDFTFRFGAGGGDIYIYILSLFIIFTYIYIVYVFPPQDVFFEKDTLLPFYVSIILFLNLNMHYRLFTFIIVGWFQAGNDDIVICTDWYLLFYVVFVFSWMNEWMDEC